MQTLDVGEGLPHYDAKRRVQERYKILTVQLNKACNGRDENPGSRMPFVIGTYMVGFGE